MSDQLANDAIKKLKAIIFDVDGILTDGRIVYDNQGNELKFFHARDGMGIRLAREAGFKLGILTARSSPCVSLRIRELRFDLYRHGAKDKSVAIVEMAAAMGVSLQEIAYMGDDLTDLKAMASSGFGITVPDATDTVKQYASYVTEKPGGQGAVREAVEHIIKGQGKWESTVQSYLPETSN